MEEIEVGEYIRTNQGIIGKIKRIELDKTDKSLKWYVFDKKRPDMNIIDEIYINKPYIVKHSKNIIDLIEIGDYVNGKLIEEIVNIQGKTCLFYDLELPMEVGLHFYSEQDIKTIVTHEQFENIEYKVETEEK